jgi:hypothetical protein
VHLGGRNVAVGEVNEWKSRNVMTMITIIPKATTVAYLRLGGALFLVDNAVAPATLGLERSDQVHRGLV